LRKEEFMKFDVKAIEEVEFKLDGKTVGIIVYEAVKEGEIFKICTGDYDLGISAEYAWINYKFPEFKITMQALTSINLNGRDIKCDVLTIENGKDEKNIIFDISDFLGKPILKESMTMAISTTDESWFTTDGKGKITDYKGKDTAVVIPAVINGVAVTAIGDCVFEKKWLTSVSIPAGVVSIGASTFSHNDLTSLSLPATVRSIGNAAFHHNKLTELSIPAGVESIGRNAFTDNALKSVSIGGDVKLTLFAFSGNFCKLYDGNGKKAGTYVFGEENQWIYGDATHGS
jgi:hypothetical protein